MAESLPRGYLRRTARNPALNRNAMPVRPAAVPCPAAAPGTRQAQIKLFWSTTWASSPSCRASLAKRRRRARARSYAVTGW